jgi:hypothetical protein
MQYAVRQKIIAKTFLGSGWQPLKPFVTSCNKIIIYDEEFLASCPTPKLTEYPLSALSGCLFNMFAATLHI